MAQVIGRYLCEVCGHPVIVLMPDQGNPKPENCVACETAMLFSGFFQGASPSSRMSKLQPKFMFLARDGSCEGDES